MQCWVGNWPTGTSIQPSAFFSVYAKGTSSRSGRIFVLNSTSTIAKRPKNTRGNS